MSESTMPLYFCCDERRRDAVRGSALNGIDYLEVVDHDAPNDADRQRFLRVHFVNDIAANSLAATNVSIAGGERIRPIVILDATIGTGDDSDVLTVEVEEPGDFSIYTLSLVRGPHDPNPPNEIDPRLAAVDFSFKVECPSDFDCAPKHICPPEPRVQPEINYLAKDYASFRKLILDRMALLLPDWRERNPADLGITLVELLAYVGDHLSYQQDAIATEAYLNSARKRVSLQRHARLVDYFVHNGTNARVWVQLTSEADLVNVPAGTQILSRLERTDPRIPPGFAARSTTRCVSIRSFSKPCTRPPFSRPTTRCRSIPGAIANVASRKARPLPPSPAISRICLTTPSSSLRNNADRSAGKRRTRTAPGAGRFASRACRLSTPRASR